RSSPSVFFKTRARSAPARPAEREMRELAALRQPYFLSYQLALQALRSASLAKVLPQALGADVRLQPVN
ncbi:hypothetical protein, partial [Anaeromusa acidaminophila]|uniref:hypothetical protein n=1 Tax=Anaeromusa acidaminophila TaxID=81464 RepID=UPI001C0310C7